ncbi:MAG: hypothetical protein IH587_04030, partial [Anaerolineae bacterium]|nr:hypothetical protein [Anaerolineae bacterium]
MFKEMVSNKDELRKQLIEKAHRQGAITFDEILSALPEAERDVAMLDDLIDELMDAGIEISSPAEHEEERFPESGGSRRSRKTGFDVDLSEIDEEELSFDWFDEELIDDAGYQHALDSDDVVGLYLKEAGRVPLLTAEEEVSLAKRMEKAEMAREMLEARGADLPLDDVYTLKDMITDGEEAQEHLVRANARLVISVAKKYIGRGVPFL